MSSNDEPLGGFFGVIGTIAGIGLALAVGGNMDAGPLCVFTVIMAVIGAGVGKFVDHVVARGLIILFLIIGFLARQAIFHTIREVFFS